MATETPGMVCGPTTGCGQTTPMVPTRIHTVNGIEKGWLAAAACSRCGKPFGFFSLINNPPPIAPLSPWFVFASSLGEPVSQEAPGLPPAQKRTFLGALDWAIGIIAQRFTHRLNGMDDLDRVREWIEAFPSRSAFSGIPRTENDVQSIADAILLRDVAEFMESHGRDEGGYSNETRATFQTSADRLRALASRLRPVVSSASPLSEKDVALVNELRYSAARAKVNVVLEVSEAAALCDLVARLSASAPSPE